MDKKIEDYLDWKGIHSPKASITYKGWLLKFVNVCGSKPIEEYRIMDIVNYQKWVKTHHSSYSLEYATVIIKNFFKFYKDQDYRCIAPSLIKRKKGHAKSHRAIKEEEFEKMISIIPDNDFWNLRDLVVVRMLWDTGVRVSELTDLNVSQIDVNNLSAVISTKKTANKRIIVWSENTHQILIKYLTMRLELPNNNSALALFVGKVNNNASSYNPRLTTRSVERIVKYYSNKAGIVERITPHSFRHGWAHKRRDMNAPLSFIQRGLGHMNPISTFIYEQYSDVDFERNAKAYHSFKQPQLKKISNPTYFIQAQTA
ncbi:MAG: site-specific integrase [Bacteroidales bacterium]|jgi:site-specific recombinase XerD